MLEYLVGGKGQTQASEVGGFCVDLLHAYPNATADAMARPRAADLPRPLAAVRVTVLHRVFSEIASTNFSTAFACGTHSNCHVLLNK